LRVATPLSELTRTEKKNFVFPWSPIGPEQKAFDLLKEAFTAASVLVHFNPDRETWLETGASDYVVAAVVS